MATRYLTMTDDLSQDFDYAAAEQLADYVAQLTRQIANAADRPRMLAAP